MAKDKIEIEVLAKGVKKAQKDIEKLQTSIKKTGKTTAKTGESMVGTFAAVAAGAFAAFQTIKKGLDLSKEFLQFQQSARAMERQFGVSADEVIKKLKEVSKGTIANADIVTSANRAMALNVTTDLDEMAQLLEIARERGKALGVDTTQAFNDLVTGIGRGSPLILDNLGIITKGWDKEAKAAGKAMDAQFILNKVLKDGAVLLKNAGDQALSGAEKFEKMEADAKDLRLVLGQVISKEFVKIIDSFNKLGEGTEKMEAIVRVVRTLIALVRFLAIQFTFIGRLFVILITPFIKLVTTIIDGFEDIKKAAQGFAEVMDAIKRGEFGEALEKLKETGKESFKTLKKLGGDFVENLKKSMEEQIASAKGELVALKDALFEIFADIDSIVEESNNKRKQGAQETAQFISEIERQLAETLKQIEADKQKALINFRKKALADGYITEQQFTTLSLKEIKKRVDAEKAAAKIKGDLLATFGDALLESNEKITSLREFSFKESIRAVVNEVATILKAKAAAAAALAFVPWPLGGPQYAGISALLFAASAGVKALGNTAIDTFQGGGVSSGGPAVVGERGPELVNLPSNARVIPHHNIDNSSTISLAGANITIMSNDPDDMMEQLEDKANAMGTSLF